MNHDDVVNEIKNKLAAEKAEKDRQNDLAKQKREKELDNERTRFRRDLERHGGSLSRLRERLKYPHVSIHYKPRSESMTRWVELGETEVLIDKTLTLFNPVLMLFGKKLVTIILLIITQAIGLYYMAMTPKIGLDFVGGSTLATISLFMAIFLAIDAIGFFAMMGLVASFEHYMTDKAYLKLLNIILTLCFFTTIGIFALNAFYRIMEVGL